MKTYDTVRRLRVMQLLISDIFLIHAAVLGALLTRFEFDLAMMAKSGFAEQYFRIAPYYTAAALTIFGLLRLYRSLWEYAGIEELKNIILAAALTDVAGSVIGGAMGVYLPRSTPVINGLYLMLGLAAVRYTYRILRRFRSRPRADRCPTMLIGGGAGGALVLRELQRSAHSRNKVVCIIDDDPNKQGTYLLGVRIVGGREDIVRYAEHYGIKDIIFALPSVPVRERRAIVELCQQTRCRIRTIPGLYQLASGQVRVSQLRDIAVEDLLGRDRVQVDLKQIGSVIAGKTVLVTGGGGSIGSELCRQIAAQNPRQLIIFDIYENNAYDIQQELKYQYPTLNLIVWIGSVRDDARVDQLFRTFRPQIVCHAAAHKHVPLMEDSPNEAVKNNVFGTWNIAHMADRYGAETFVLISSDKAVNPTNVMGATKRICEMIVQVMNKHSATCFTAVRFGNVLGSNGSVIPLFQRQIAHGGPVTVTHKDIIRYFMTISEAVSLVLQACAYAQGGEVFVLDMGDPVRIDDLARNMIRLCGLEPDVDIPIVYTGLRPGEKLFEELLMQDEGLDKTPNELIFIGHFNDFDEERLLDGLREACEENSPDIRARIQALVRTYHPAANEPAAPTEQPVLA